MLDSRFGLVLIVFVFNDLFFRVFIKRLRIIFYFIFIFVGGVVFSGSFFGFYSFVELMVVVFSGLGLLS